MLSNRNRLSTAFGLGTLLPFITNNAMTPPTKPEKPTTIPLCVDLDGTLIKTDMLWESVVRLLKRNPFALISILLWWTHGRAFLKQQLAARVAVNATTLPVNEKFLAWLRAEKKSGRKIILATASDLKMAQPVADPFGLFDQVLASDGQTNLRSGNKLRLLTQKFGKRGFDYAGNSSADFAVWRGARQAIVVNASPSVEKKAAACATIGKIFAPDSSFTGTLSRSLRPHQWVKNLIIFVPALAGHKLNDPALLLRDGQAFAAFCLCASGVYLLNDLVDLDADRQHPTKRNRPFAAGDLPLPFGLIGAPLLLAAGVLAAARLSWAFAAVTVLYVALTTIYSCWVKQIILLDVFFLAGLYTLRLVAGSVATGIVNSSWLLVFSMAIFLSLALVKRYVELTEPTELAAGKRLATGRGYFTQHLKLVARLGIGSGWLAVLVLAFYVRQSEQVSLLYQHPRLLLLACPLLLFWISRAWQLARRGEMHDDPVVFALKDWTSYLVGALTLLVMWLAAKH
jgi:4-hydroxybenzoate polyprenyltransferase/phosphoserine phosphatase